MTDTTIRSYSSIDKIPADALRLFAAAEAQYPEFAPGWFANLQRTVFTDDPGVRYYVAERAGQPVALLPLRLSRHGVFRRVEALGNYYTSLYSPLLAPEATELDLAVLLQVASRDHGTAHVMRIRPMAPNSPVYQTLLSALRSSGWISFQFFNFGNWYQPISGNWLDYFNQRESQLRNTIKRKGKKFVASGGTLEIITDQNQSKTAAADFNHVYARSWKKPEPFPEFIPSLVNWLAEKGWLRLGIARLNGQPIAAQLWIVSHGRANIFKLAYDEKYSNLASGTLLTAHLMERVIDTDRVGEIDYLIGDDPYKQQWMSRRRERFGIIAYNPRTVIGLLSCGYEVVTKIIGRCRETMAQRSRTT